MNGKILILLSLTFLIFTGPSLTFVHAADSVTPAIENICDGWVFTGQVHGLCNAYCEAMDCDDVNPQASDQACARILKKILNTLPDGVAFPTCKDSDSDGVPNGLDNCPDVANNDQADSNGDRIGDACTSSSPCPEEMAFIDSGFCIDRWEAHIEGQSPYYFPNVVGIAKSEEGVVPQGYINGVAAATACTLAGKRLCTSVEWLRACQGPDGWTYPYGNTYQSGACNDRGVHPLITMYGPDPPDSAWSDLGNPILNQQVDTVDLTGQNESCVTAEGVFDLVGNLHEWVADVDGTFRGGSYFDTYIIDEGCLYATTAHNSLHWDFPTGFRCCADAL